jgi:hypothetical protein
MIHMLDRIGTQSTYRIPARSSILTETNQGDAFDNTSPKPSRVEISKQDNGSSETTDRFANLLWQIPYLQHGLMASEQQRQANSGAAANEKTGSGDMNTVPGDQAVAENDDVLQAASRRADEPGMTANQRLAWELADMLRVKRV